MVKTKSDRVKRLAKASGVAQYTFGKLSPLATGINLTTLIALYTGYNWFLCMFVVIVVFIISSIILHASGLMREEYGYLIGELGTGKR